MLPNILLEEIQQDPYTVSRAMIKEQLGAGIRLALGTQLVEDQVEDLNWCIRETVGEDLWTLKT